MIARLQSMLDQEQVRRRNLIRAGVIAACAALVLVAVTVVLARGNASAAARTVATAVEPVQVAETPSLSPPESRAAATSVPSAKKAAPAELTAEPPAVAAPSTAAKPKTKPKPQPAPLPQRFRIAIGAQGYEPSVIRASAGSPVILRVARGEGCAAGFLIPELGVDEDNSGGAVTVNLGRVTAGRYQFSCGMEMVTGTLIVK